jgi:Trk K+ transport system NAD-binding subunit
VARISKDVKLRQRARYYFDNSISRGPSAFIAWLAVAGVIISVAITIVRYIVDGIPKDTTFHKAITSFGTTINTVLFGGAVPTGTLSARFIAILIWFSAITISATIIGFITNRIKERVEKLRTGRSPIIESGHTLILGWSNRVFPVIQQLAVANENTHRPLIVVVANGAQEKMEKEIADRVDELGKTRVLVRAGDPTNPIALKKANIAGASAIIALDSDDASDSEIVSTVLAIKASGDELVSPIVAEVNDASFGDALVEATHGRVLPVHSNEIIARVTAQASRQPGLAAVVLDLLDFEGDEIYFQEIPALVGKSYAEALIAFDKASVIGIRTSAGRTLVHPALTTKILAGDSVIAIASDDDQVIFTGIDEELAQVRRIRNTKNKAQRAENLLIIGWSEMGGTVLNELAPFLPKGSSVTILANPALVDKAAMPKKSYGSIKISFKANDGSISELAAVARNKRYDEIIVLAYREKIDVADADARTMLTMLLLNKLFDEDGNGVERTRLVAEILDSRRADLARVANADDLVVSDNLAALLAAQLSQNPDLGPVFEDIFDADGAALNVRPLTQYANVGDEIRYLDLVALGRSYEETVLGIRSVAQGVLMNPSKSSTYVVGEGDGLIVLSTLE